ncbi:MAG: SDR family NAD(P)-dependent oxidoreductase [Clostridia bacterium]|nr:SDR family NAD(P)-dependent oxidoreductase [Clostridia bacterium]
MNIAIITGASSGLGTEFVRAAAKRYKTLDEIWVIARRADRLEKLKEELPEAHLRPLALDLTAQEDLEKLKGLLAEEKPSVRLLLNNAGCYSGGLFDETDSGALQRMIDLNITALTAVSKICFPYMQEKSYEVMTASISSFSPGPAFAVYNATKAYVAYLGRALRMERKRKGINVLTLCPGRMDTELFLGETVNADRLPALNVAKVARKTLRKAEAGKGVYTPGWFYKGYRVVCKIFPRQLLMKISGGFVNEV